MYFSDGFHCLCLENVCVMVIHMYALLINMKFKSENCKSLLMAVTGKFAVSDL